MSANRFTTSRSRSRALGSTITVLLAALLLSACSMIGLPDPWLHNEVEAISAEIDPASAGDIVDEANAGEGGMNGAPSHMVLIAGSDAPEIVSDNLADAGFEIDDSLEDSVYWSRLKSSDEYNLVTVESVKVGDTVYMHGDKITVADDGAFITIY